METYLAAIVPALRRAGHEVGCWFETAGDGADPVIGPAAGVVSWVASANPDRGVADLAAWKPDVVYGHGVASPAHERATLRLAPAVFFAHSYYGACISGTKSLPAPGPAHAATASSALAAWRTITRGAAAGGVR